MVDKNFFIGKIKIFILDLEVLSGYEMDIFDSKLDFDFESNHSILKKIAYIDTFSGEWNNSVNVNSAFYKTQKKNCSPEKVFALISMDIGDISKDRLLEVYSKKVLPVSDKENMITAFKQALSIIEKNFDQIKLAPNYLKGLHQRLLQDRSSEINSRGKYKTAPNQFIALDDEGNKVVIAETSLPQNVESQVANLLEWLNINISNHKYHPLVMIALTYYELISIHPFQSANSAFAKILLNLLFLQSGYGFISYISQESYFLKNKSEYYHSLLDALNNRGKKEENISSWLQYLLDSVISEIKKLKEDKEEYDKKGVYLNKRQKKVLEFIKENQPIKLADLNDKFKRVSVNTLKKDLAYMKNENVIATHGKNKGTVYYIR